MTKAKMRSRVREAYRECLAVARAAGAAELLEQACAAAAEGERAHRRFMRGPKRSYALSVEGCAWFFAVRFFLSEKWCEPPKDWVLACRIRDDARFAYAAAFTCNGFDSSSWEALCEAYTDVLAIDYAGEIAS